MAASMITPAKASIREKQKNAIFSMLGYDPSAITHEPEWKVLIYDDMGQDIISPLLNIGMLREAGVTLNLNIATKRDPIDDVPAVYLLMPTRENVQKICNDLEHNLYESYQLCFLEALPRALLEQLAKTASDQDCAGKISKVYDMYCNFIALEDDLFCVRERSKENISYFALNNQEARDADIEASMEEITNCLFSVLVTVGVIPIIRCSRRNAAEEIAKRLDQKLRDHVKNTRSSLFSDMSSLSGSFARPVLILLDRNLDTTTILHHTWTYQALIHDLFDMKLNRVSFEEQVKDGDGRISTVARSYDLDTTDDFWVAQRGKPFPEVATAIDDVVSDYRQRQKEISELKGNISGEDAGANTAALTSAVNAVPELMAKKKTLDMHTSLLTTIMEGLKQRKLDQYYETEEEVMNKKTLTRAIEDILSDPEAGTPEDRMRLFIIYYMDNDLSEGEVEKLQNILSSHGCDLAAINYLKQMKRIMKLAHQPAMTAEHKGGSLFSHASKVQSKLGEFWKQGVKTLMPTSGDLPITRIVDALMELRPSELTKDYLYFDPKLLRGTATTAVPKNRAPFEEAVVFMVGGSNYTEYQNLIDYAERQQGQKSILFGTSEIMDAGEFLRHLGRLGTQQSS